MTIKETNQRAIIFQLIKEKLGAYSLWTRIEPKIALMCADIPEIISTEDKSLVILSLRKIRQFLMEQEVKEDELLFLDEEIERYEKTKQISLYDEKENELDPELIKKYSRAGPSSEGVVGIHLALNYEQLKKLTNGVYTRTNLIKFYISQEKRIPGKITAEVYEHPQDIPLATLCESKSKDKETGEPLFRRILLFGEKVNKKEVSVLKEITIPFRVYRFISEANQDFILLSDKEIDTGDCIITGVTTKIDDFKALTDSAKLPTKLPYIFVHNVKDRIIKFKEIGEFRKRIAELRVTKRELFNFPFTIEIKKELKTLKHPDWFKWLIWAWLTHSRVGLTAKYPLHLMIIGEKNTGKSTIMNCLHKRSKEIRDIFSGVGSTLKNLVPSFKYKPAKLGYLAESNRFAFCDEFLRCISGTRSTAEGAQREESIAMMNDLLEHQKRETGSGVSRARPNMTARILAATNPIKGIHNVNDLTNFLDGSFLSRWLIYYQTKEHYDPIRKSNDGELKIHKYRISTDDFISIVDYLQSFPAEYDVKRINEILDSVAPVLNKNLKDHYDARHRHHIECLMDGIIKTRCLFERDMSFKSREEDYEILKEIWYKVINSWIDGTQIRNIPVEQRKYYIPENAQYLFKVVCDEKAPIERLKFEELALKEMNINEYRESHILLRDLGLIYERNGSVVPYYMEKDERE